MPRTTNPQKKLHVKKGDRVRVIAGNAKGQEGRVLRVYPARERVIVEGVNVRIRHTKPNQQNPQGARLEREMPIHVSNVQPLDAAGNPTRVGRRYDEAQGTWVRTAVSTGDDLA
jgi:large subunit ribosomal protein L24